MLERRQFGCSSEQVTVLGLGGGVLNRRSYHDGVAAVRRAVEIGINFFDTSPHYCDNESQSIIGEALAESRSPVFVATKLGHFDDAEAFRSPAALSAQLEDNLRRLRRPSVDLLQIHEADWACWWAPGALPGELVQPEQVIEVNDAPILQFLRQVKRDGLCRRIGITGNNADSVATILSKAEVDSVLVAWNYDLLFRGARRMALPMAQRKGVAFIAAAVLHGGLLTSSPQTSHVDFTPLLANRLASLQALQVSTGIPLNEIAIRYLLADARVNVILVGAASPSEVDSAAQAVRAGPLSSNLQEQIEALGLDE